jgi:hypothetical protein
MNFTFYLHHLDIFRLNLETFPYQVSNILIQKDFLQLFSHFEKFRGVAPMQMFGLFQALTKNFLHLTNTVRVLIFLIF